MSNKKISQLPIATSTEGANFPIVQNGLNKQLSDSFLMSYDRSFIDEDDFSSDSSTAAPSQQSTKVYIDTTISTSITIYATRNGMITTTVPVGITALRVNGYSVVGDGGDALYTKVLAEPTHPGKFQSGDGAWWEITEAIITPQMFGAKATGIIDDTIAVQAACDTAGLADLTLHFPNGVYGVSSSNALTSAILLTAPIRITADSVFLTEIKALSTCLSLIEWNPASGGEFLYLTDLQLNCNNLATDGFRQVKGCVQGSTIGRLRVLNPISKNWHCMSYLYSMQINQIVCSGGEYGIFGQGNGPTNGAQFNNCRISNTTIRAVHLENTAVSTSTCAFDSLTVEGNDGGGLYNKNIRTVVYESHFENNGQIGGAPDIEIDSASSIRSRVEIYNPTFATASAAQIANNNIRAKRSASNCEFIIRGGNTSKTNFTFDGGGFTTGCRIENYYAPIKIVRAIGSSIVTRGDNFDVAPALVFGTTATLTGLSWWGNGWVYITAKRRTSTLNEVGMYQISFDNPAVSIHWLDNVVCATTANITLSGEQTLDGILTATSRVLVKNQTTATENGIYVSAAGAWTRATDANTGTELGASATKIVGGTTLGGQSWRCTNTVSLVIGTDNIAFTVLTGGATINFIGGTDVATFDNDRGELTITRASGSEGWYSISGTVTVIDLQQ